MKVQPDLWVGPVGGGGRWRQLEPLPGALPLGALALGPPFSKHGVLWPGGSRTAACPW